MIKSSIRVIGGLGACCVPCDHIRMQSVGRGYVIISALIQMKDTHYIHCPPVHNVHNQLMCPVNYEHTLSSTLVEIEFTISHCTVFN
jgi:hypothetical protein